MSIRLPERILVVGGCGFLGHHIVRQLVEAGCKKVSVLDLRTDRNRQAGVSYHNGDITSPDDVAKVLDAEKPVALIHTASPIATEHVPTSVYDKVNIKGTENLLLTAGNAGHVKSFIYTSSASVVYDYVSDLRFVDEKWPVLKKPDTPDHYSHTKAVAEELVTSSNLKWGDMRTVAIRPAGIFGEGDVQLIPGAINVYRTGKTKFQMGDNNNLWDWTYVGNVAHAHILATQALLLTHEREGNVLDFERVDGEAFFITNDQPVPFWDLMRAIWAKAGWQGGKPFIIPGGVGLFISAAASWLFWIFTLGTRAPPLSIGKGIPMSIQHRTYNIEKAKSRLGYKPQVPLEVGVQRGVQWALDNEAAKKEK